MNIRATLLKKVAKKSMLEYYTTGLRNRGPLNNTKTLKGGHSGPFRIIQNVRHPPFPGPFQKPVSWQGFFTISYIKAALVFSNQIYVGINKGVPILEQNVKISAIVIM